MHLINAKQDFEAHRFGDYCFALAMARYLRFIAHEIHIDQPFLGSCIWCYCLCSAI